MGPICKHGLYFIGDDTIKEKLYREKTLLFPLYTRPTFHHFSLVRTVSQILKHDLNRSAKAPPVLLGVLANRLLRAEFSRRGSGLRDDVVGMGDNEALRVFSVRGLEDHLRGRVP